MARKHSPGLYQRNGIWHIDKQIRGQRICESTGESNLQAAEEYLAHRIDETRKARTYGVRPQRTFKQAATKYLEDNLDKKTIGDDARRLRDVMPYIGDQPLDRVNNDSLKPYIDACRKKGNKSGTINHGIGAVRQVLNAAVEWFDENNLTWLERSPKLKLLPNKDKAPPYPLSWEEQDRLFEQLPSHLREIAEFTVNTGCRDGEIVNLRWAWERRIPILDTTVFIIPKEVTKNGDDKLVVLNKTARSVVERARGKNQKFVFTYRRKPMTRILNSGWCAARMRAGLPHVRVHDLRHTFATRLRHKHVSLEDRKQLLGHRNKDITTEYSAAELGHLIEMANRVTERDEEVVVILRQQASGF